MPYQSAEAKNEIVEAITEIYPNKPIDDLTNSEIIEALAKALPSIIIDCYSRNLKEGFNTLSLYSDR